MPNVGVFLESNRGSLQAHLCIDLPEAPWQNIKTDYRGDFYKGYLMHWKSFAR